MRLTTFLASTTLLATLAIGKADAQTSPNSNTLPTGWSYVNPALDPSGPPPSNTPQPNYLGYGSMTQANAYAGTFTCTQNGQTVQPSQVIMTVYIPGDDGTYGQQTTAPTAKVTGTKTSINYSNGSVTFKKQPPDGTTVTVTYIYTLLLVAIPQWEIHHPRILLGH